MPIVDLQRRIREIGRIRIGDTVEGVSQGGKKFSRPTKLTTFKLTSRDRQVIDAAAGLWGGTVEAWDGKGHDDQWAVVTDTASLSVIVPPADMSFSQWYETWSGGGCVKRCDGNNDVLRDRPCDCNPEARDCKIHTRLSVMLPELAGLGVWRIDTQGYYAAVEIGGAVEIAAAAQRGQMLPARLRLEQREVLRDGKRNKFAVPVLDVDVAPAALLGGEIPAASIGSGQRAALAPSPSAALPSGPSFTPVPEDDSPPPSIADQVAASSNRQPTPRANAAAPIPSTGVSTRTSAEAKVCSRCQQPYGTDELVKGGDGESRFVHRVCGTADDATTVDPDADPFPPERAPDGQAIGIAATAAFPTVKGRGSSTQMERLRHALAAGTNTEGRYHVAELTDDERTVLHGTLRRIADGHASASWDDDGLVITQGEQSLSFPWVHLATDNGEVAS